MFGGVPYLVMTSTVSAPGPATVLGTLTSAVTSMAMISLASSSRPVPIVIGSLAIHVDQPFIFGFVGSRFMPASEVVEWAFAGGMVLTSTGPKVVRVPGIHGTIELIGATVEERDPLVICIAIYGWRGSVNVEESNGGPAFHDLEGNNL